MTAAKIYATGYEPKGGYGIQSPVFEMPLKNLLVKYFDLLDYPSGFQRDG
ncbi:MAG: hypothetical protein PHI11_14935 [Gallionella sp.]|nr:hypothetical protein [Gallionella sp.]